MSPFLAAPPKPNYPAMIEALVGLVDLIEAEQDRRNLTLLTVSREMGVSITTLSNLYAGKVQPSYTTALAALRWLATSGGR